MNSKVQELIDDLKSKSYSFERTTITDSKYSIAKTIADIHLSNDTIRDRINYMAHKYPDSIAYRFCDTEHDDITFTYSQLKQKVEIISQNLLNIGLKKGDCVAYQYCNSYESMIILFASANIGLISVPLGPNYITFHVEYMLKKANVKCLFIMDEFNNCKYFELFKQICPELDNCEKGQLNSVRLPDLKHVILSRMNADKSKQVNECKGVWKYEEIGEKNELFRYDFELPSISAHDPFVIIYTSGTTGQRKGCVMNFYKYYNSSKISLSVDNYDSIKLICNLFGMFATGAVFVAILPPLYHEVQIVFPNRKKDFEQTMKIIEKYKCRTLTAAPKVLYDFINDDKFSSYNLSSIDYVFSGGQMCIRELIEKSISKFDLKKFIIVYGMTEIGFTTSSIIHKLTKDKRKILSIGKPEPFIMFKIVDFDSKLPVPHDQVGLLYVKAYSTLDFYWNDPEKTKEAFDKDGWFNTGDIAKMDKDGFIFFLDRFKDYIDIGGHKVYPSEIEALLKQHPSVSAVNVFGIDLNVLQETICAWIILKKDCLNTTVDEIKLFCKDQLMEYRIPAYMKFVNDFPTDPGSGKMLKREMSKIYKQEIVERLNQQSI